MNIINPVYKYNNETDKKYKMKNVGDNDSNSLNVKMEVINNIERKWLFNVLTIMIIAHNIANQVKNIPKFIGPNIICWLPIEVLIKRAIKNTLLLIAKIFN